MMTRTFLSGRLRHLQGALLLNMALTLCCAAGTFQLVSVIDSGQTPPVSGGGDSYAPIISPNGRFVLFASTANNLLSKSNNAPIPLLMPRSLNVFLRDRTNGTVKLASVNVVGTGGGNGDSIPTGLSSDGRYALFESQASDLVLDDTNNATDIFVRDMVIGTTTLVSVSTNGGVANGPCRGSVMTPDGRYVAFVSEAGNLVSDDTNRIAGVFLRDLQSATTTLISAGAMPRSASFRGSESPEVTPDGRFVAFYSTATNLVSGLTGPSEIYVRDNLAGTIIRASTNAGTIMQSLFGTSNVFSFNHAISADGKFVVFEASTNSPNPAVARGLILRFSLDTGLTDLVNTNAYAPRTVLYEDIHTLEMTPDGRFVAFVANTNDITGATTCIYLWDGQSGTTILVSGDLGGHVPTNSTCDWPTIDPTGRFIAFLSSAPGLVTNSLAGDYHLYLRDVQTSVTTLIDADTHGIGSSIGPATMPKMSTDGRSIAFESLEGNLVANDLNHASDVFVRELAANVTDLISARDPALPSATANGPSTISPFALSGDGRWVAFSSDADNLITNDTNVVRDIFLRDLLLQTNFLVSVATNGANSDGPSTEPAISSNGRFVAFTSLADNLVPGDSNRAQDVFVRDVESGNTVLASVNLTGVGPGNHESFSPTLSPDGRFVLFRSRATNLGLAVSGIENLFLRDLQSAVTYTLTASGISIGSVATFSPDGSLVGFNSADSRLFLWSVQSGAIVYSNAIGFLSQLAISPNNQRVAVTLAPALSSLRAVDRLSNSNRQISTSVAGGARAGVRFSGDSRFLAYAAAPPPYQSLQVFLYDFQTGTTNLISQSFDGLNPGNADSDFPVISPDGRFVMYRSSAGNLVAGTGNNSSPNLFQFDRTLGATTILTPSVYGNGPADNRSFFPSLSANGGTLLIQSAASDLVGHDFNQSTDLFALARLLYVWTIAAGSGGSPTLAWFARPGENYHVQYKTTLSDSGWQEVSAPVTIIGGTARVTDAEPASSQRFYRVVAF